jgi:glucose/arabinose dehydrogenase
MAEARRSSGAIAQRLGAVAASVVLIASVAVAVFIGSEAPAEAAVPSGFTEVTAFSGLQNPTAVRFAPDGRVFVAEKRGVIQMYDGVGDTTPTAVADLRTEVYNFWDRGMLGLAVDPGFPARPYLYAMYAFDGPVGGTAPQWGTAGADSDPCPTPPGASTDGCVASGKLVRLALDMSNPSAATTTKQDLVHDWCQQYPSHSIGDLVFGRDGALYASGGDGASFDWVDYGQAGSPVNPCGDPPSGVGGAMTPPTAEGGALRAQDLRTSADPVGLSGTVIRVNPDTGLAMADNPNAGAADLNAQRIVAYGLRNPFRMSTRPGTDELWLGDVGWNTTEEIDRLVSPKTAVGNFGWPCFEGDVRQSSYDAADLKICEDLYAQGTADAKPYYSYKHGQPLNANDNCNVSRGSSTSGISFEFYSGGPYPAEYDGALFFSDYSRNCVWVMTKGTDGLPDKLKVKPFVSDAAGPVDLELSPQGELFYADLNGGTIRRVVYNAAPPTTCPDGQYLAQYFPNTTLTGTAASQLCEPAPLNHDWGAGGPAGVGVDGYSARWTGRMSFPSNSTYTFTAVTDDGMRVWIDGQILIDEWRNQLATFTASRALTAGNHDVRIDYFETNQGAVAKFSWTGGVTNAPPTPTITTPAAGTTWKVGDTITFDGSATDPEDGALPASSLSWEMVLQHCPADCHAHQLQTWSGVSGGSITAPDHEYPAYLELRLTATDRNGQTATVSRRLDPQTATVSVASQPAGLQLTLGSQTATAPYTRTLIVGSTVSLSAPSPQSVPSGTYEFGQWSDGGVQSHNVTVGTTAATYTATYTQTAAPTCPVGQYQAEYFANTTLSGTPATLVCETAPLNHDWGAGGPAGVGIDGYSARWAGTFSFPTSSTYTFTATTDDGMRVWIDGVLLLDEWRNQLATFTASRALTAGAHDVKIEYFETNQGAVAKFDWTTAQPPPPPPPPPPPATCSTGQYRAEYFANRTLSGAPASTGCEAAPLNRNWGSGGPAGAGTNNFSARWTGSISFAAGNTTFTAASDDGMRVWLDGVLIVDRWGGAGTSTVTRNVTAGAHAVKVEYFEKTGTAFARLTWTP